MSVNYEWIVEEIDADDDIIDVWHFDTRAEADAAAKEGPRHGGVRMDVGLVRDVGNDVDGLTDRQWAYVRDGILEDHFSHGGGERGPAVPKRFLFR